MFKAMNLRVLLAFVSVLGVGCESHDLEKNFFKEPLGTRLERLRQYDLRDQYKIFRYGNDVIEPPLFDLANPIAEKGATAVPFLLRQLHSSDDVATRDILLIFQKMAYAKSYDVKSDSTVMNALTSRVSRVKEKGLKATCLEGLKNIQDSR